MVLKFIILLVNKISIILIIDNKSCIINNLMKEINSIGWYINPLNIGIHTRLFFLKLKQEVKFK